jgi:protein TonB
MSARFEVNVSRATIRVPMLIAAVILAGAVTAAAADKDKWVEVNSDHFLVVSNDGAGTARRMARAFEEVRAAAETWFNAELSNHRPVVIVAVKNEATMNALTPGYTDGSTDPSPKRPLSLRVSAIDREYILVRADVEAVGLNVNPRLAAYAAYMSLTLDSAFKDRLPLWLSRGIPLVLANTIVREKEVQFARPIPEFVRRFAQQPRWSLPDLFKIDRSSPYSKQLPSSMYFESQCWALVHYLMFRGQGTQREAFASAMQLILQGVSSDEAVRRIFGDLGTLEKAYIDYVSTGRFPFVTVKTRTDLPDAKLPVRDLAAAESAALHAGVLLGRGRAADALSLIAAARQANAADLTALHEIEGHAARMAKDPTRARQAFERAVALGSKNFSVYYALASERWTPQASPATFAEIETLVRRAIVLDDTFAPAHMLLAATLARLNQFDAALPVVTRAVALEPADLTARLMQMDVLARLSRRDDAMAAGREALKVAATDEERRNVQQRLDALAAPSPAIGRALQAIAEAPPPPPPPPPPHPVRVGGDIKPPAQLKKVEPIYPPIAQSARVQGIVMLQATIGPDGRVADAQVLRSIPLLDQAAIDAVRQWEFAPTIVDGAAVAVTMSVVVQFSLK